ncbi:MAG TPA: ribosome-binding factor A [Phycisphaerae bacterium]|nr:ribosome-binding factor A [Phycisphaerae bacterium]HNU46180.1 ribosome-binding factor A [Phycisphaerae bacterium]
MPSRKRKRNVLRAPCAHLHADDGVDPREDKRRDAELERRPDRKLLQLCKQVAQALQLAFGELPQADALFGASVREVAPAPSAERLRAVVVTPDPARRAQIAAILQRHSGRLRAEVASAITRHRAPELTFEVVMEGGDS